MIFTAWGLEVETAKHGVEALERLQKQHVGGATLGIIMPYMPGIEVLRKIRETHQDMPVFTISGGYGSLGEVELRYLLDNAQIFLSNRFHVKNSKVPLIDGSAHPTGSALLIALPHIIPTFYVTNFVRDDEKGNHSKTDLPAHFFLAMSSQ